MIKAGIIGGSGYTGSELIRILLQHRLVEIDFVYSSTKAGAWIYETHEDLLGTCHLKFSDEVNTEVDVIFLCLGHGNSTTFLNTYTFSKRTKIIDLSNDFRLKKDASLHGKKFIYGLPELNKLDIEKANYIANPGCFATSIELALLPLAASQKLNHDIHINAMTGSTGAGVGLSDTTHFSWRNNNVSWYKPFTHQHLGEINETLQSLQKTESSLYLIPQRGDFARGIFTTAYTKFEGSLSDAYHLYESFYKETPFTHLSSKVLHLKQVVNTNHCHIHLHKHNDILLITSIIDNLLKGAGGQAVQNMNLMFGFDEKEGLNLKANYF